MYHTYTSIDFALDEAFLQHYLSPTPESEQFWHDWLTVHPNQAAEWHQARQLLEAIQLGLREYTRVYLSEEAEAQLLARIQRSNALADLVSAPKPYWKRTWAQVAAACVVVAALGYGVVVTRSASLYQKRVQELSDTHVEKVNDSSAEQLVRLPDGSMVRLAPHSRVSFDSNFGQHDRRVYLSGKAFFSVVKNQDSPFYVYANELVTKVLGTKFEVDAFNETKDVVVKVQSGQVSVFRHDESEITTHPARPGVLLQPNQQVVFTRKSHEFSKMLVENPAVLNVPQKPSFQYDETSVLVVLKDLEKSYGIEIIANAEMLSSCQLTASLGEETLHSKLDIICHSIGATYEIIDGKIIITSKGC